MIVWPGLRRSVSAISRLFNSAAFDAPLTHSAIPTRAASGTTATFTRATASTWKNNDGYMVTGVAGEIGFVGARRVRNFSLGKTEDLTVAGGWGLSNITTPGLATVTAPDGTTTGWVLTATANSAQWYRQCTGMTPNGTGLEHIWLRRNTGSGAVQLFNAAGAAAGDLGITTSWAQYSLPVTITAGGTAYLGIQINVSGDKVEVWHPQLEDVTAQTTQTAGEYVSVGVTSAPYYHGSMVDGVKCFATDINGAAIPSTTLLGYLAEGARTNLCPYSQSIAAGFTFSGTCTGTDNVGIYAGIPFTRISNATGGVSYSTISYTGNGTKAFSCLLKKDGAVTGTYSVGFYDNSASVVRGYVTATIAADGGMTFAANGGCTVTGSRELADGVWELQGTVAGIVASNANIYYANFAVGTATSCLVSAMQTENASFPSTYIATTTIAVARNADVLTYSGGDIPNLKTLSATFRREVGVSTSGTVVALTDGTANERHTLIYNTATQFFIVGSDGGVNQYLMQPTYTPGTDAKAASTFATNDVKASFNGAAQTPDTSATMPTVTQVNVGHEATSAQLYGTASGIYGWTRNLSQSELGAITS